MSRKPNRRDVAIYAPLAGSLYHADARVWTGGAELQAHRIARALADRGLRVAHILREDGTLPPRREGVDLIFEVSRKRGPRGTRRVAAMWEALNRADASVYVQRSAGLATGVVGAYARAKRRCFVYSLSSSADLHRWPPTSTENTIKELGLRLADGVVAQTIEQRDVAVRKLGPKVTLIRSFSEPRACHLQPEAFLWIGGVIDYKDPLAYIELARRVPEAQFVMVVTIRAGWETLAHDVAARAMSLPNLTILPPRPRDELLALYARAVAVVGTSTFEGFPNTFMEAWAGGVPVLSLAVDPDGVIVRHRLGAFAGGSLERLSELARSYWARRHSPLVEGAAGKQYIAREHHPAVIGDAWAELISRLIP